MRLPVKFIMIIVGYGYIRQVWNPVNVINTSLRAAAFGMPNSIFFAILGRKDAAVPHKQELKRLLNAKRVNSQFLLPENCIS